jgi:hypothetical protein
MLFIATAESQEADDKAAGRVRRYDASNTHTDADVWWSNEAPPNGVWLTPDGEWRMIVWNSDEDGPQGTSRNFCCCPFCKSLRAKGKQMTEHRLNEMVTFYKRQRGKPPATMTELATAWSDFGGVNVDGFEQPVSLAEMDPKTHYKECLWLRMLADRPEANALLARAVGCQERGGRGN